MNTTTATILLQATDLCKCLLLFRRKQDIPSHLGLPIRLNLGLWGLWWGVRGTNGLHKQFPAVLKLSD